MIVVESFFLGEVEGDQTLYRRPRGNAHGRGDAETENVKEMQQTVQTYNVSKSACSIIVVYGLSYSKGPAEDDNFDTNVHNGQPSTAVQPAEYRDISPVIFFVPCDVRINCLITHRV